MSHNQGSPSSLQPLSIGNTVSVAFRLYRSHLKSYLLLALLVFLWSLLPFLFVIPAVIVLVANTRSANSPLAWIIVIIITLALYLYTIGKGLVNASIISRLAFAELINQPETIARARSQVQPKLWNFVLTIFLLSLIFFGVFFAIFLAFLVFPIAISQFSLLFFLNIVLFFSAIIFIIWLIVKFFLADTILAIEENQSSFNVIIRSWNLTKGNVWRIVLILLLALLITLPIQIIIELISRGVRQALIQQLIIVRTNTSIHLFFLFALAYYLLTVTILFLTNIIFLPFWQAIKGIIYYDLRSRREGLGLKLRDFEI